MSETSNKRLFQEAKQIHNKNSSSSIELENFLFYLRDLSQQKKTTMIPCCCCGKANTKTSSSIKKGLKNFQKRQVIDLYHKNCRLVEDVKNKNFKDLGDLSVQKKCWFIFNEEGGSWQTKQVQVDPKKCTIKFRSSSEILDLHHYIMRKSKKKQRLSICLESVEAFQLPQTIRMSNNNETFDLWKSSLEKLIEKAWEDNICRFLDTEETRDLQLKKKNTPLRNQGSLDQRLNNAIIQSNNQLANKSNNQYQINTRAQNQMGQQDQTKDQFTNLFKGIQMEKFLNPTSSELLNNNEEIMNNLNDFDGFQKVDQNSFYNPQKNLLKKTCLVTDDYLCKKWFQDHLTNFSTFKRWKKSLQEVKLLNWDKNSKTFLQKHKFTDRVSGSYAYKRTTFKKGAKTYFIDKSLKKRSQNGFIDYCLWQIDDSSNKISITVQGKIIHNGFSNLQYTRQFMGDFSYITQNMNMTLFDDSDVNIDAVNFQEQYLSQISIYGENQEEDFYSISQGSKDKTQNKDYNWSNNNFLKNIESPKMVNMTKKNENYQTLNKPASIIDIQITPDFQEKSLDRKQTLLNFKHIISPLQKPSKPNLKKPKVKGTHVYWEGQWKFNQKGQMINDNQQKIQKQKSVLKDVLKSIGRNLFSGKSILNVSLPVTVFGIQSNLSLFCKSYSYAPNLLEKASQEQDPIMRMVYAIGFGISCNVGYIEMQKPFNPILGETYNCLIDKCPVFAQQISHHPPISSTFMKGRGYTFYGSFQSKVNLGLNTATGSNDGIMNISFNKNDINAEVVKFSLPPGEMGGLTIGERKLSIVGKTHYLDQENRLFIELNWSKHKGSSQFCKFYDGVEGRIVKLKEGTDMQFKNLKNIKKKHIEEQYGMINGRWTRQVFYETELIFDSWQMHPYEVEPYPHPLESNGFFRKDIIYRIQNDYENSQKYKQELEEIQRNDRKLREKFIKKK